MSDAAVAHRNILRIYYIYRCAGLGVGVEPGCGIDLEGCADYQEDVCGLNCLDGCLYLRDGLAEPDDVRPELGTVRSLVAEMDGIGAYVKDGLFGVAVHVVEAVLRADLRELTVEMDYPRAACPFVEIVHILGHDGHVIVIFKPGYGNVGGIGPDCRKLGAAGVIEIQDSGRIPVPTFYRSHIFHPVVFPQSVAVAEGADAAIGRDAGTGKNNQLFYVI